MSIKYDFEEPITRGDKKLGSVNLRRPKAGELKGLSVQAIQEGDVASIIMLLPRITEPALTKSECEDLDMTDLSKIGTEIVLFFASKKDRALLNS